ncbi:BrnT family toxin [Hydrogenovibrio halophilus]|uniref:BrnT family toxin n=1 Tax=Hydrogenovibrio halophilus TaxID=373391 RepID=UPI00036CD523|nr:BrnT family toxin [Hydrogenovibrio halophilus]
MDILTKMEIPEYEFRLIIGGTQIDYDKSKEMSNRKKHGYSLESAVHYFEQLLLPIKHSPFMTSDAFIENGEVRHMHMGIDDSGNVVLFVTTMREEETVRVISFRRARKSECKIFYQNIDYNNSLNLNELTRGGF